MLVHTLLDFCCRAAGGQPSIMPSHRAAHLPGSSCTPLPYAPASTRRQEAHPRTPQIPCGAAQRGAGANHTVAGRAGAAAQCGHLTSHTHAELVTQQNAPAHALILTADGAPVAWHTRELADLKDPVQQPTLLWPQAGAPRSVRPAQCGPLLATPGVVLLCATPRGASSSPFSPMAAPPPMTMPMCVVGLVPSAAAPALWLAA